MLVMFIMFGGGGREKLLVKEFLNIRWGLGS